MHLYIPHLVRWSIEPKAIHSDKQAIFQKKE